MKRLVSLSLLSLCTFNTYAAPTEAISSGTSPIEIKIKLVTPRDILVNWKDPVPGAGGYIVEWGTKPDDEFVPLGFFPPTENTYTHPDLMWETPCYYRIRPIYGPASEEIVVALSDEISDAEYKRRFVQAEDYRWAGPQTIPDEKPVAKKTIRKGPNVAEGAPTNFKAEIMPITVSAFKLTWTDNSSDEAGFMIEQKLDGEKDFHVVALTEPDINSFGWAYGYPHRKGTLRVRAYYYGNASDLITLTTGPEPVEKPAEKEAEKPAADAKH